MLIPDKWVDCFQVSPKNLRLSAIIISIYEIVSRNIFSPTLNNLYRLSNMNLIFCAKIQMIAHVIMFVMLLGLINAEKAQKLLMEDIEDQKEMEDYYYYPAVNNRGDTLDIVRLNSATKLASSTVFKLTVGTGIATVYLLVCLGLFAGVVKNRANLIVPWMIFDVIVSLINNSILIIIGTSMLYERFDISEWLYCESNANRNRLLSQLTNQLVSYLQGPSASSTQYLTCAHGLSFSTTTVLSSRCQSCARKLSSSVQHR